MPQPINPAARVVTAFLTLAILCSVTLHAQWNWEPVNDGLQGVHISSIVHDLQGRMIVGTAHGIYKYDRDYIELYDSPWLRTDSTIRFPELTRARDGTLSARTEYGYFISYDEGITWRKILDNAYVPFTLIHDSTFAWCSGDRFYFATGDARFAREEQVGRDASLVTHGSDGTIYVVIDDAFIVSSTNSGRLWNEVASSGTWTTGFPLINQLHVIGSDTLIANLHYATYRSSDRGKNWSLVHEQLGSIYPGDNGILYGFGPRAAIATPYESLGQLYQSADAGLTWQHHGFYHENRSMINMDGVYYNGSFAADGNGTLYQGLYGQLYSSLDSGRTWNERDENLKNIRVRNLVYDGRSRSIYTAVSRESVVQVFFTKSRIEEYQSLYRLDDEWGVWLPVRDTISRILGVDSTGNLYVQIDKYVYRDNGPYEVISNIALSRDRGDTWVELDSVVNGSVPTFSMHSSISGVVLLETFQQRPGPGNLTLTFFTHYLSTDSGKTWRRTEQWLPDTLKKTMVFHILDNGGILFSGSSVDSAGDPGENGLWKYDPFTGDVALLDTSYFDFLVPAPDGTLYSNRNRRLHHSTDQGNTWNPLPMPFPFFIVENLKIGAGNEVYLHGYTTTPAWDSVFRSSDMGITWTILPYDQSELKDHYPQIPALLGRDVLVDSLRVWPEVQGLTSTTERFNHFGWSTDRGITWMLDQGELTGKSVTAILLVDGRDLLVGTKEDGVYRISSFLSVDDEKEESSSLLSLRVVPTPLTNTGQVRFHLERPCLTRLELFDPLGRPIALLTDNHMEAGEHSLQLDFHQLASGSYFLRLTAGRRTETVTLLVH